MQETRTRWLRGALCAALLLALAAPALAAGVCKGQVTDAEGNPLQGVVVKLIPTRDDLPTIEAVTNKKGKYVFGLVRNANYRLVAFKEGMRIYRVDANIAVPEDDSLWAFHDEVPQGAELPIFTVTGVTKVAYDLKFKETSSEPGDYGTGIPVSPTSVIVEMLEGGRGDEALREIDRQLEDNPDSPVYNYLMAFVKRSSSERDAALAAIDRCLAVEPAFEGGNLLKANILVELQRPEEARTFFETELATAQAAEVQRDAWLGLALLHEQAGRYDEAIVALEKVVAVAPEHVGAYKELADLYLRQGDEEKARERMAQVEALGASDPYVLYNMGAERFNASDFEAAANYFAKAVAADPQFKDAHLRLAYTQLNLGQMEGAAESLRRFLELSTEDNEEVTTARAILQQISGP